MPHASVAGHDLHYERHGEGEPLLLLQGLSGNHLHWGEPFLSRLDGLEAIAFDHRGMGHSAVVDGPFSIADLADDAVALLDALELDRVHVMGISMGGMVAQEIVLRHPDRVRALVLGCTYAGGEGSALTDRAIVAELTQLFMAGKVGEAMSTGWGYNVSPDFVAQHPEAFAHIKAIAKELPGRLDVMLAQVQAIGSHDTSERLEDIRAPTLVIHGSADQILPVANGRAIAARVPGARLEIFDGVGHLFWWERPERSAELVLEATAAARAPQ